MNAPVSTLRSLLFRPAATPRPALTLILLAASATLTVAGCGDSGEDSAGLSAGAACEGEAPVMCEPGCEPLCSEGAWSCACPESTASSNSTTDATGTTTSQATTGGVSSTTGEGSTTTSTTTTTTTGDSTTEPAATMTESGATSDSDGTTRGGGSTSSTSGDDSSTGSTTEAPWEELQHVHIEIDNFCQVSVDPPAIDVPADETVKLSYHNHSVDYEADVWLSYGGGYLELELGNTWDDPFEWCTGPNPSVGYADISIAGGGNNSCPKYQLKINCE